VRSSYRASRIPSFSLTPDRNRGLRFWRYTSSKRRPQPASNSDNGPRGTDAEEPCKFRFRDAPGSSPPPAPRWDQHELDRQISDLGTILAAQVVEFDGSGRALDQHHRATPAAASGCAKRGRGRTIVTFRLAYHSDGGLRGVIADRIAAGHVGRPLSQSLKNLQRLVDS
jgi:hypothetical protein